MSATDEVGNAGEGIGNAFTDAAASTKNGKDTLRKLETAFNDLNNVVSKTGSAFLNSSQEFKKYNQVLDAANLSAKHAIKGIKGGKTKQAISLFNYIHSLDSEKLAIALHKEEMLSGKKIKYFIQVNIGEELQKSGIRKSQLNPLLNFCKNNTKLEIIGLMCIPPKDDQAVKYFREIKQLANELNFSEISMGMSQDYKEAILFGATFVRIGSNIYK